MKRALFLLNMGGPGNLKEVETFLRNMFQDPHILQINPVLRTLVSRIIVAKRLGEAQENYRQIGGKSPLLEITRSLAKKVADLLHMPVFPVMRYVQPYAKEALEACQKEGIDEIILFPLYPHYSTTTVQSSIDDVMFWSKQIGYTPKFITAQTYFDHPEYIDILVGLIRERVSDDEANGFDLILSAHGLPLKIIRNGDPYEKHIQGSASAIKQSLFERGCRFRDIKIAYQSKVGKGEWLEPNLSDILRNPKNRKVVIAPIAFCIDNSETVFELDIEHREIAQKLHYEAYRLSACPNDSTAFSAFIARRVLELTKR